MVSRNKKRRENKGRNNTRTKEGHYPYHPATVLDVEFWPDLETLGDGTSTQEIVDQDSGVIIRSTVVETFSRTLSCVLLVSVDLGGLEDKSRAAFIGNRNYESRKEIAVILKLYDRRFSDGIREDYGAAEWTPKIEVDRRKFEALDEHEKPKVCVGGENDSWLYKSSGEEEEGRKEGGDGSKLELRVVDHQERPKLDGKESKRKIRGGKKATNDTVDGGQPSQAVGPQQKISPSKWTAGHREAYIQKVCDRSFSTEHSIYQHLRTVQGRSVPFVYGTVRLGDHINGLMMEYIHPSFTLRGIPANVPDTGMWQELGELAVRVVQDVGDCGVLNEDVRLDNILVIPVKEGYYEDRGAEEDSDNSSDGSRKLRYFKAVMIDFGLARVRRDDEADEDWNKARYFRDEEGAVGYVLEKFLRTAAGSETRPFKFRHSHRLDYE